jgi:predicted ester cyclase
MKGEPNMVDDEHMVAEENKALIRLFDEEVWNQGHLAAVDELMTANATIVLPGLGPVNREGFKAFAASLRSAFPDWHATIDELIAEGDQVASRWTGRGTHQGEFQGMSPTGRLVTLPGMVFYRLVAGKITEFRGQFDGLALMQQLGTMSAQR